MKQNWIKLDAFCEQFNVTDVNVHTQKHLGILDERSICKDGKFLYLDSIWYKRRNEFKLKMQYFNQEMYYYFEDHMSVQQMAKMAHVYDNNVNISSLREYLRDRLFRVNETSILNTKATSYEWIFYRFCHAFIRAISRKAGHRICPTEILDRRMNDANSNMPRLQRGKRVS